MPAALGSTVVFAAAWPRWQGFEARHEELCRTVRLPLVLLGSLELEPRNSVDSHSIQTKGTPFVLFSLLS